MPRILALLASSALILTACGRGRSTESMVPEYASRPTLRVQSSAFAEGGEIPKPFTCDGKYISPPLAWSGVPEATRSLALICEDPDAPGGTFTHWVLFGLSPGAKELPEGVPAESRVKVGSGEESGAQGKNDFGNLGYGGPCPPKGRHRYIFRLYSLDMVPNLEPGASRAQLLEAIKGHVTAEGRLTGTYTR
jgi:Raf kinase inhibitor-like YbhB/YbcL family protein